MALILSWFVSVMVAPLYGYKIIKVKVKRNDKGEIDPYQNKFYKAFRKILYMCLTHRKKVLLGTVVIFGVSIYCLSFVKQEFFYFWCVYILFELR